MEWLIIGVIILFIIGAFGKAKEKAEADKKKEEILKRQKEAEDYILSSGDTDAIKMLMLARANPSNYAQVLQGGMNKGNDTLKTALGVMAGVAVGNLAANAITAAAISSALEGMEEDLASIDADSLGEIDADIADAGDSFDFDIFS